jgi:hypothetical protein
LRTLFRQDSVVYAKPAFGGPAQVLRYLGRYTHRVAVSNHRLLEFDGERVTFRWKGYNFDLNLTKSIPFGEARRLEFRWEALNAFNHPQFVNVPQMSVNGTSAGRFLNRDYTDSGIRSMWVQAKVIF